MMHLPAPVPDLASSSRSMPISWEPHEQSPERTSGSSHACGCECRVHPAACFLSLERPWLAVHVLATVGASRLGIKHMRESVELPFSCTHLHSLKSSHGCPAVSLESHMHGCAQQTLQGLIRHAHVLAKLQGPASHACQAERMTDKAPQWARRAPIWVRLQASSCLCTCSGWNRVWPS